jgi:hypothetical protein
VKSMAVGQKAGRRGVSISGRVSFRGGGNSGLLSEPVATGLEIASD